MRRRTPVGAVLAALAAALLLAGCTAAGPSGGGDTGYVSSDGSVRVVPVEDRKPAPELSGTTIDGKAFDAADLDGKVVVVNVWASWCAPCRAEAPGLERLSQATRSLGVQFLGLNSKDEPDAARAFVRRFDLTYPSLDGNDGRVLLGFRTSLPSEAIPTTWVIDRTGRVAARALGKPSESTLRDLIEDLAAEPAATARAR
jgi:thiol-disulfide isomerase/thioredoxin